MDVCAVLLAVLAAQTPCVDPPTPAGGFGVQVARDVEFGYGDGYRTRYDLYAPDAAPGPCGWPVVLVVHFLHGAKEDVAADADAWARAGYGALAFDVRGQGLSYALNDPGTFGPTLTGVREVVDLFEFLEGATAAVPGQLDPARLAVTGDSQGATFSYLAAAFSESAPPPNPWRTAPFPRVTCVAPFAMTPDRLERDFPGGTRASNRLLRQVLSPRPYAVPAADLTWLRNALLAEDFQSVIDLRRQAGMDILPRLATTRTAMLVRHSWDDAISNTSGASDLWDTLRTDVAHRVVYGTGAHFTPTNDAQRASWEALRRRYFDWALKGGDPLVASESPQVWNVVPSDPLDYGDPLHLWEQVATAENEVPGTYRSVLWLGAGGALSPFGPIAATGEDLLRHRVPPALDMQAYAAWQPPPSVLTTDPAGIPLASLVYETTPFANERLLAGRPVAHLRLTSDQPSAQVSVALFDVDPTGGARWIAGGHRTLLGLQAGTALAVDVRCAPVCTRVPAGHRLRLAVENLAWDRPPVGIEYELRSVPLFSDFDVGVQRNAAAASSLELPFVEAAFVGTYCEVRPNTATPGARMGFRGSTRVTADDATLSVTRMPQTSIGLFLASLQTGQAPFGEGLLCLTPPIYRLPPPAKSTAQGTLAWPLSTKHSPLPPGVLVPGATLHFQFRFRDVAGGPAGFNTTDGLRVTFRP